MKKRVKWTNAAVGKILNDVILEYYRYAEETTPCLNDIGLRFEGGVDLIFGCSGDGSISVTKGKLNVHHGIPGVEESFVQSIDAFAGTRLLRADFEDSALKLTFSNDILVLRNVDDELVMVVEKNGKQ